MSKNCFKFHRKQTNPIDLDELNIVALSEFDGDFIETEFWSIFRKKAQLCFFSKCLRIAMKINFFKFHRMQANPIDLDELNIVALSEFAGDFIETEFRSFSRQKANIRFFSLRSLACELR